MGESSIQVSFIQPVEELQDEEAVGAEVGGYGQQTKEKRETTPKIDQRSWLDAETAWQGLPFQAVESFRSPSRLVAGILNSIAFKTSGSNIDRRQTPIQVACLREA